MNKKEFVNPIINGKKVTNILVSRDGDITNLYGSPLPEYIDKRGYHKVHVNGSTFLLHRIIAETFIPNPLNLPTVNHKKGNKDLNSADELEWMSYSDNNIHALENGLRKPLSCDKHQYATLTNDEVKDICSLLESGLAYKVISEKLHLTHIKNIESKIKMIYTGNAWKEISKDYTFPLSQAGGKYSDEVIHSICTLLSEGERNYKKILETIGLEDNIQHRKLVSFIKTRRKYKYISNFYYWDNLCECKEIHYI